MCSHPVLLPAFQQCRRLSNVQRSSCDVRDVFHGFDAYSQPGNTLIVAVVNCNARRQSSYVNKYETTQSNDAQVPRWIVFEVLSCGLEIAVVSFPVFLVKDLQMKTQAKASVVGWFSLRLLFVDVFF